jgi:parvulin-like peptidyl-prolyl isomerase
VKQQYVCLAVLLAVSVGCQKPPASHSSQPGASTPVPTTAAPGGAPAAAAKAPAAPPAAKPVPAELPAVICRVNGDEIKRPEFESTIQNVERRAGRPVPPEQRDQVYRGVLDDLISMRLLKQEVARRQLSATDAEMAEAMKQVRGQFPNEAAFKQALASQGMTPEKFRDETRTQVLVSKVLEQEIGSKIAVTPAEISGFYEKNPRSPPRCLLPSSE